MAEYCVSVQELHEYQIMVDAHDLLEAKLKAMIIFDREKDKYEPAFASFTKSLLPIDEWSCEEV